MKCADRRKQDTAFCALTEYQLFKDAVSIKNFNNVELSIAY
jgi:hypothetical protein